VPSATVLPDALLGVHEDWRFGDSLTDGWQRFGGYLLGEFGRLLDLQIARLIPLADFLGCALWCIKKNAATPTITNASTTPTIIIILERLAEGCTREVCTKFSGEVDPEAVSEETVESDEGGGEESGVFFAESSAFSKGSFELLFPSIMFMIMAHAQSKPQQFYYTLPKLAA
jgi:hypothetical protein